MDTDLNVWNVVLSFLYPKVKKIIVIRITTERYIPLLSTLSKVYDKILLKRYENWFRATLSNLQGVAEKGGSSINTALLLHEAFAHTENTYVVLLDVKKAFDSVWIKGLMYKLINLGMDKRLWSVIYDSYNGFKCSFKTGWQSPSCRYPTMQHKKKQINTFVMKGLPVTKSL